ncbi:MAG TPA: FTR1 family protein [Roseiflexaceae bacterium]|nr:FTR1 family protein [Roseiflexaceae bacterium]
MLSRMRFMLVLAVALCSLVVLPHVSYAQTSNPVDDLKLLHSYVETALHEAQEGDLDKASAAFTKFREGWPAIEDGIRDASRDSYREIEEYMGDARVALAANDQAAAVKALEQLEQVDEAFIEGHGATTAAPVAEASLASATEKLTEASEALERGDTAYALKEIEEFAAVWPDVEGEVKATSPEVYRSTEDTMPLLEDHLRHGDVAAAQQVLGPMRTNLEQVAAQAPRYGLFDVMSILLREGLEALLVIAALLAFLQRSGNGDKRRWIWGGGLLGVLASVGVGALLVWVFQGVFSGSNRELVEGLTGLFAAVMLFSVSYWMHGKAQADAWQKYIRAKTTSALATGSLFSLALLAFLSVFREGAETTVMYLGIAPSIAVSDLLLGISLAVIILTIIGILIMYAGVRLPLRLFFLVTSVLIFYLGFKFIGTGIHALQVAQVIPANVSPYLPSGEFLGIFPTWETTVPQIVLLVIAAAVVWWTRQSQGQGARQSAA